MSADWALRLKQGMKHYLSILMKALMPCLHEGGCFECTDEQLMSAIKAMLPTKK